MRSVCSWLLCLLLFLSSTVGEPGAEQSVKPAVPSLERAAPGADLFATAGVHRFNIDLRPEALRSLRREPRKYVSSSITIDGRLYTNVQLHLKGSIGSFRPVDDKPGLTLSFAESKGNARFARLKKFHLNNSVQDPTYLSELICSELFRAAGVPATRVTHAWVKINGRTRGLYTLKEAFNHEFLANYFQNTRGNLYGQSGGADVTEPLERVQGDGDNTHSDLRRLAAAAEEPDSAKRWKRLQEVLDVDRFLSFAALEVLLCHWDGYTFSQHNYRVYHDLDSDKMVFFPHDMDQMMGDPSTPILPNANGLVSRAVLTTSEGRAQYRERFGTLFTNLFRASALSNRIHTLVAQLTPAIRACDPSMANEFEQMAATLTERIMQRSRTVTKLFQVPEPKPLHFVNGVAPLANWRSQIEQGSLELDRGQSGDQPVLRIQCNRGGGTASWRTAALLEPGTYRLLGRARTVGVVPRQDGRGLGGGVRISGEPRRNHLVGTADWVDLDHEFTVENDLREVVLVCELRAVQGEIWFDLNSLRLVRTGSER